VIKLKLRIEKEEFINKTFRLSKRLVDEMQVICYDKGISMNRLVDICLKYSLENMEDD